MSTSTPPARRRGPGRPGNDQATVLRKSIALFNRQGYEATSMGDLAKELGFTKSAIYHHINSKSDLLKQALDEALDNLEAALSAAQSDASRSPGDRLRLAIQASIEVLVAHLPAVTLLLRVRGNSQVELDALARRRAIDDRLARMVAEAAEDGALRDDIPPDLISRLLFGQVNSLVEWIRPDGKYDAATLSRAVTTIAFDGLQR